MIGWEMRTRKKRETKIRIHNVSIFSVAYFYKVGLKHLMVARNKINGPEAARQHTLVENVF